MTATVYRKHLFDIPENLIYLDGNSLGPLPRAVAERVGSVVTKQWGEKLIKGWNECQWMQQPSDVGDRVAKLIGAPPNSVVMGDTLSIKVYQALSAALQLNPDRYVVLSDTGNFPTDLYMAQGLIDTLGSAYSLKLVEPEEVIDAIDDTVAAVLLTQVDYRTGRLHDLDAITSKTHQAGAISIWDLAHSAGALPVDLTKSHCDFAVGCSYKYLNGGPGAPAFIYTRPDLIASINPALAGWLGHDAPFAFEPNYRPAASINRMRVGTPPVLQMSALDAALDVWDTVDMQLLRQVSMELCDYFIKEVESRCPQLSLVSPRDAKQRGSQVSFAFEQGYAAMRALIERGVIGDFRAPNIMRFGFTPLYVDRSDVAAAVDVLEEIMAREIWKERQYQVVSAVT